MIRLTPRGQTATVLAVTAFLIGGPWLATITGNILTGNTETSGSQGGSHPTRVREGSLPVGGPTLAPAAAPTVRPVPTRAARSRPTSPGHDRANSHRTGRTLSCTCYVATGNRTASGEWPRPGTAASNLYSFGTVLRVEGVGLVRINDRVGHSSDLDLFFTSRPDCLRFGRQPLHVEVIGRG